MRQDFDTSPRNLILFQHLPLASARLQRFAMIQFVNIHNIVVQLQFLNTHHI